MIHDDLFGGADWAEVLRLAYGFHVRLTDDGLPFVRLDDLAGRRVSTLPFSDYLPLDDRAFVFTQMTSLRQQFPDHSVTVKSTLAVPEALPPGMEIARRAVYHRYRAGGKSASDFRRGARKAAREGIVGQRSTAPEALDRFLQLYHWQRMRKFGGIPQPPSFFRAVYEVFMTRGKGFFLEAFTTEGDIAASLVVLRAGKGWFYKFGASAPAYLALRPNNLLFQELTTAVDAGEADFLDLGLSGAGDSYAGLRRFKAGTGAAEFPITYLRYPTLADPAVVAFRDFLRAFTTGVAAADRGQAATVPVSESLYRYLA